jgi:hypothetical protein
MSRADEIAQGLREEGGALTFPLNCEEYGQGFADYRAGNPPPSFTTASYDLGRNLGRRRAEEAADDQAVMDALKVEQERRHQAVRDMLKDRPDVLAEYDAKIAAIRSGS